VLIRHLWQLKIVVFLHWCLICAISLTIVISDACTTISIVNNASRIVLDDVSVPLQIVASLTHNSRGVIYNCNMLILQERAHFVSQL
jgi:hypothetical protein